MACIEIGQSVQKPGSVVEVTCQQRAGVTAEEGVDSECLLPAYMSQQDVVGQRKVILLGS
jgi:hypothetical protein